jgi:hypothetical protein
VRDLCEPLAQLEVRTHPAGDHQAPMAAGRERAARFLRERSDDGLLETPRDVRAHRRVGRTVAQGY